MTESCFEDGPATRLDEEDLRQWEIASRDDRSPFIHRFQTQRHKYVYDVNTRRIIRVWPVVWDVLADYGLMGSDQIVAKHSSSHEVAEIKAALEEVALAREQKGLFLSLHPSEIVIASREKIEERLREQREQLILNVTEDCNFRCSYCVYGGGYGHHRTHSAGKMSWEVARAAIDEFLSHSGHSEGRVISFYGGEPLLNLPLIRRSVAHVRRNSGQADVRFALTTNGYLLTGETAKFLSREGFLIVISLDAVSYTHLTLPTN